jgi:hypothetical protein
MAVQINKTNKTPYVHLSAETGVFLLEGVVLPEDTFAFFNPINMYITDYLKDPNSETKLILKLDYFNTAASRMLYNLLKSFNDAFHKTKTTVDFHYEDDDEDLSEVCDEFSEMLSDLNFNKRPYDLLDAPTFEQLI